MNKNTLIAVCGYAGDAALIRKFLPFHEQHECPVIIMSPTDSPILKMRNHICRHAGKRAYIGQDSLTRQIDYMKILLNDYPHEHFLLNDSDSFCASAELPRQWYDDCDGVLWENQVEDPRTHESKYPKWAFQPGYFLNRATMERMVAVAGLCPAHPITPYVDHFMVQLTYEAGLRHRPFTDAEHGSREVFCGDDPWKQLEHRIKYCGAVAMHPIKNLAQATMIKRARRFYELHHK